MAYSSRRFRLCFAQLLLLAFAVIVESAQAGSVSHGHWVPNRTLPSGILLLIPGYNGCGEAMMDERWKAFAEKPRLVLLAPTCMTRPEELPEERGRSTYGWLDKVTELIQPDGSKVIFTYWPDGQLAAKRASGPQISQTDTDSVQRVSHQSMQSVSRSPAKTDEVKSVDDSFLWDGLALLKRNDTIYIIEPHPSGGIPVASHPVGRPDEITWHLNDLLGTTLATVENGRSQFAKLTAFGQPLKLASNIPAGIPASADSPALPAVPEPASIQRTTANP